MWRGRASGSLRVLVTGVGGNVGQGVLKALAASGLASWVVGVDANPLSAGLFLVDKGYVVPRATEEEFLDSFCSIIIREQVSMVFVCADAEALSIARLREKIETTTNAFVLLSPVDTVERCADKWLTARWFASAHLPHPATVRADDSEGRRRLVSHCGFPLIVKPRFGYASRGVVLSQNSPQLELEAQNLGEGGVVQEYLDQADQEYTAATFSSTPGVVDACIVMRRELLQGTSYRVEPVFDQTLEREVSRWGEAMHGLGPLNFQFRLTDRGPVCFEVNPRFSGTVGIRFHFGYNDVEMALRHFLLGERLERPTLRDGMVLRYWEELYLPRQRSEVATLASRITTSENDHD